MDEKTARNVEKWTNEVNILENVKRQIKKYRELKDDRENDSKEEMNRTGGSISEALDDNKWTKLTWKEIKRSGRALDEGLEKIDRKISDRKKKLEASQPEDSGKEEAAEESDTTAVEKDWSGEIRSCGVESVYYHWAYGKMEVVDMEGDYIYLRPLDRKGCSTVVLSKNDTVVKIGGREEIVKEFSVSSIGRWLYPDAGDVKIIDPALAHKSYSR